MWKSSDFSLSDSGAVSSSESLFFHFFFADFDTLSSELGSNSPIPSLPCLWNRVLKGCFFKLSPPLCFSTFRGSFTKLSDIKIDFVSLSFSLIWISQNGFSWETPNSFLALAKEQVFRLPTSRKPLSSLFFPFLFNDGKLKTDFTPLICFIAEFCLDLFFELEVSLLIKLFSSFKSITDHSSLEFAFDDPTITSLASISAPWIANLCNNGLFEEWYSSSVMHFAYNSSYKRNNTQKGLKGATFFLIWT